MPTSSIPSRTTLAYSDAMLLPALPARRCIWLGVTPLLVYNLLILASIVSAGLGMLRARCAS